MEFYEKVIKSEYLTCWYLYEQHQIEEIGLKSGRTDELSVSGAETKVYHLDHIWPYWWASKG